MKKILSLIMVMSLLIACLGIVAVSAEELSYPALAVSGGDPGNAIVLEEGMSYSVHFNTTAAFKGFRIAQWTPGSQKGIADYTMTVYAWNKDFETSRKGTPVAKASGTSTKDDMAYDIVLDKEVPAGNYVAVLEVTALNEDALPGMHIQSGTIDEGKEKCFEWETDATKNAFGDRAATFRLIVEGKVNESIFAELPEETPDEGDSGNSDPAPAEKPYVDWADYGKGVHVSWDSLRVNEAGNFIGGIQDGGANLSAWLKDHDNTVDGSDSSISKLFVKGWTGLDQKVVKVGYSVDGGAPVFSAEADALDYNVSDPVKAAGGEFAVRYNLTIDVSQISGKHEITVVVELEDGTVVSLAAGDPPMVFTYEGPGAKTPETPDSPATSDATAVVFMIAAAAVVVTVLLKKRAF